MATHLIIWSAIFIISLGALIYAADKFTETAEKIGIIFKIPGFIIGVTIVALGTSIPEIATSISAVLKDNSQIVIGNVIGSNMANILLVLPIVAIVAKKLEVTKDIIKIDLPILLGSTILLFLMTLDGKFGYIDGIIALLTFATYIIYNIKAGRKSDDDLDELEKEERKEAKKSRIEIKYPLILLATGTVIAISADFTIKAVIELASLLSIGEEIIAITAISIGTSLPELTTSVIAAKKGKASMAIGNITGSNIFNALAVMGIPSLMGELIIPESFILFTIPALLFVTILYVFVMIDREISQWEGITLLLIYVAFIGKTLNII